MKNDRVSPFRIEVPSEVLGNLRQVMPRGGHFAAMEEPELLADDIRTWFRTFRAGAK
jgi:hypothetical protein